MADRKYIDIRQAFFYKYSFEKFSIGPCGWRTVILTD
jgi:hypothetical protein